MTRQQFKTIRVVRSQLKKFNKMSRIVKVYSTPFLLAESLANDIVNKLTAGIEGSRIISIALSGGKTPLPFFSVLGDHFSSSVDWKNIHFFWSDERCVLSDSAESNFGMAEASFIGRLNIPPANIHRIIGENDPELEAVRYSKEIESIVPETDGMPSFDLTILGLGEDGHIASVFPGNESLFFSDTLTDVTVHPLSGQKRITMTGKLINNSQDIFFIVTGISKASIIKEILLDNVPEKKYPASLVSAANGNTYWYLDKDAASLLADKTGEF